MKVTCLIGPAIDSYSAGRVFAGLYEQRGVTVDIQLADWITNEGSMALVINRRRIGIELDDQADRFDHVLLDWCDVYAKRSVSVHHTTLPDPRIVPLGLNCAGRSKRSLLRVLYALKRVLPSGANLHSLRRYVASPHWRAFEYGPYESVTETVLFQTRLWDPIEAPGDAIVNEERVQLLLDLKKAFGRRFVGGLMPNAYAREHYPALISQHPHRQPQYIAWAKRSAVGIYSRGLFGSVAFKMAEFLASSKCIVTEPIDHKLTASLHHASTFRSSDECIAHCELFLSNPHLVRQAREMSWNYYQHYVLPSALIGRLLQRAL